MSRRGTLSRRGRQVAAFGTVSVVTTVLDFALFNVLVNGGTALLFANTISYGAGIVASYLLNKHWTFEGGGRDKLHHEVALFLAINVAGLWLNNLGVLLAANTINESTLILNMAKLAAGAATWVLKYVTFKKWVYPVVVASPRFDDTPDGRGLGLDG